MEILGIGPSELVFIIIIALIILGPKDMQKAGRSIGRWLNQLVRSDGWKAFQQTSREIRNLPTNLMREANMEMAQMEKEILKATTPTPKPGAATPVTPPNPDPSVGLSADLPQPTEPENTIQPPSAKPADADETSQSSDSTK